jgi:hypothetical protein
LNEWAPDELDWIGATPEIEIAPAGAAGQRRRFTTIWVVRVGDELYVRSYHGPSGVWYRAAKRSGEGRIRARGSERDVTFQQPPDNGERSVDDAYRAKYGRSAYVDAMLAPDAKTTTLRLGPAERLRKEHGDGRD